MNDQLRNYQNLESSTEHLISRKQKINLFFDDIAKNVIVLYKSSFELIDLYGEFYVLTERIWVTCDNIFRVFQNRAKEIDRAMSQDHFKIIENNMGKIKLPRMEFVEFEKITLFDGVEVDFEDASYLMCSLSVEVSNRDLVYLGSEFELRLVVNNEIDEIDKNRFIFKVGSEDEVTHVYKTFVLDSGKNIGSSFCLD